MEIDFVSDKRFASKLRDLMQEAESLVFAVAFWGEGASEQLGLHKLRVGQEAKIVCDLDSGGCNPKEVEKLMSLRGVTVKKLSGLHAKVYWSRHGVLVGSSNASANGLAYEANELAGNIEANTFSSDVSLIEQVKLWLDNRVLVEADEISKEDIKRAKTRWTLKRETRGISTTKGNSRRNLLEEFKKSRDILADRKIVVWVREDEDLDAPAHEKFNDISAKLDDPTLSCYQDSTAEPGTIIIDFYHNSGQKIADVKRLRFDAMWQVPSDNHIHKYPKKGKTPAGTILLCRKLKTFEGFEFSKEEIKELGEKVLQYFKQHKSKKGEREVPLIDILFAPEK
jgi:HKD family nuclease